MKNPRINRIDLLIDNLSIEFSKIPNFELTQSDETGNRMFNYIMRKFFDIQDFKTLYKRYFIPAANKAIADTKKELTSSFYRKILNVTEQQLKENYYDTIRMGYVGLFHKMENFVKDTLFEANILFNDNKDGEESIEKYFELNYNFKFNNWYSDIVSHKINWISNCVKHYDGYPMKEPKFKYLTHLPEDVRINIGKEEFYKDIEYITNTFYHFKLSQILSLSVFKMATNDLDIDEMDSETKKLFIKLENDIKQIMN